MTDQHRRPAETSDIKAGAEGRVPVILDDAFQLPGSTLKDLIGDNRFLVVPETMVDGLIVIDEGGIIHYVNPACTLLVNYERDELLGRNVKHRMLSPFRAQHDENLTSHL